MREVPSLVPKNFELLAIWFNLFIKNMELQSWSDSFIDAERR